MASTFSHSLHFHSSQAHRQKQHDNDSETDIFEHKQQYRHHRSSNFTPPSAQFLHSPAQFIHNLRQSFDPYASDPAAEQDQPESMREIMNRGIEEVNRALSQDSEKQQQHHQQQNNKKPSAAETNHEPQTAEAEAEKHGEQQRSVEAESEQKAPTNDLGIVAEQMPAEAPVEEEEGKPEQMPQPPLSTSQTAKETEQLKAHQEETIPSTQHEHQEAEAIEEQEVKYDVPVARSLRPRKAELSYQPQQKIDYSMQTKGQSYEGKTELEGKEEKKTTATAKTAKKERKRKSESAAESTARLNESEVPAKKRHRKVTKATKNTNKPPTKTTTTPSKQTKTMGKQSRTQSSKAKTVAKPKAKAATRK